MFCSGGRYPCSHLVLSSSTYQGLDLQAPSTNTPRWTWVQILREGEGDIYLQISEKYELPPNQNTQNYSKLNKCVFRLPIVYI